MKNSNNTLTTKRFVIRKSLLGKNTVITFTNKKGDTITYITTKFMKEIKKDLSQWNVSKSISLIQIQTIFQHFVEIYKSLQNYDNSLLLILT